MSSFTLLTTLLLCVLFSAVTALPLDLDQPDFSQYIKSSTLNISSGDRSTRLLFVGDVHGRFDDLQALLHKANYDPAAGDILIHTGDIVTKSDLPSSKRVLEWMAQNDVLGVRGNHDQAVIDWKGWRDWISSTAAGKAWLRSLDQEWERENERTASSKVIDPISWVRERRKNSPRRFKAWWRRVPQGWKMFNEHYLIASSMGQREYEYLRSLPLVLHIPSIHAFTAHAGILASDVTLPASDKSQPLAHLPAPPRSVGPVIDEASLRFWQESAILKDVPQNNDPWNTLNMRSIRRDGSISRRNKKGKPWTKSYNEMMDRCVGYGSSDLAEDTTSRGLPCMPASVIYGHAAARGLDINRWTFGLDTGCSYGRKLTALVIELPPHHASFIEEEEEEEEEEEDYVEDTISHDPNEQLPQETFSSSQQRQRRLRFGDNGSPITASLIDVSCSR